MKTILFPFYFLLMLPIEYDLWKAYKKEGKTNQNLIQFIYGRLG